MPLLHLRSRLHDYLERRAEAIHAQKVPSDIINFAILDQNLWIYQIWGLKWMEGSHLFSAFLVSNILKSANGKEEG